MNLTGIHHLTAISANIRENYHFYTQTLGMRLVKRSVNQDDVSAYHLFYADAVGSPGSDMTFFDWPMTRERRGNNSVTRSSLRVNGANTVDWWAQRFSALGVTHNEVKEYDGRLTLDFEDSEGQRLALIDDGGAGDPPRPWDRSPVPAEHQIRGLGPMLMSVPRLEPTQLVLTEALNMRKVRDYLHPDNHAHAVHVYAMGAGGPDKELHVTVQPELPRGQQGAGGVHHVAFRTPNEAEYHAWSDRLNQFGIRHSGEVDRYYFRSLYLREPGGVLFEIATDGPGFAVDEDAATLGESVVLPPFLESRREEIVANLKPID